VHSDLAEGFRAWPLWSTLAWQEVASKYRRTLLGPLWITSGLAALVFGIGLVYSGLFKQSIDEYLPYLCTGFIAWFFIIAMVNESCFILLNAVGILKQTKLPLSVFAFQFVTRNLIIFAHNLLVYAAVYLLFDIRLTVASWLFFPAVALYLLSGLALAILLSIVCARYRDVPQIVPTVMQIAFFLTPIFWRVDDLSERGAFVLFNPFHHYVALLREPLLGGQASLLSWGVVVAATVFLWAAALFVLRKYRHRVIFWI
jgi:ABC-2 type transport system permease protein/lipopolysaccharide transport system permease protein